MGTSISFRSGNKLQTILFDAATSIRPTFKNEVTRHPVEKSSDATDGTRKECDEVTLDAVVTDYPLKIDGNGIGAPHEAGRASDILSLLLKLKATGTRVLLQTSLRNYANMVIAQIMPNTDRLKGAIKMVINFVESQTVDSETVDVEVATNRINQKEQDKGEKTPAPASDKDKADSFAFKGEHSNVGEALKKAGSQIVRGLSGL